MIERIQSFKIDRNHGFRFVVAGDTRSNLKVFQAIAKSVNKWNPLFDIDVGDLTLYGYSNETDRYHFQTLEKYAFYPFLPVHSYSTATYKGVDYTVPGGGGAGLHMQYGELGSVHNYVVVDVLPGRIHMRLVRLNPEAE